MTAENILKIIKEKEIDYVDLRFTDPRGKLQHLTQDISTIETMELSLTVLLSLDGRQLMNRT
jgi:glutamine synthetase